MQNEVNFQLVDHTCPVCGKNFIPASEHIYTDGKTKLCGWNCYCAAKKNKDDPSKDSLKKVNQISKRSDKILCVYKSVEEAARSTGVSVRSIRDCCTGVHRTGGGFKWSYAEE
jgi:hypothetical protein